LVHEEGYGIQTHVYGEFTFILPNDKPLSNNRHGRFRGNVFQLEVSNANDGLRITPETSVPKFDDHPIDYDSAVLTLVQAESTTGS